MTVDLAAGERITVVIPTKDGGRLFAELLTALQRQMCWNDTQLIVVDSGSQDDTVANAKAAGAHVIEICPAEFNHGATRDLGISMAQTEFVALLVQDAMPNDEYMLLNLLAPFVDASVAGVYARQIPRPEADLLTKRNLNQWLTGRSQPEVRQMLSPEWYEQLLPMEKYLFSNFDNVCSAVRKSVWENHKFGTVNFGEDIDWAERVLKAGFKIAYQPSAAVVHSHDRPLSYEYKRTYICHRKLFRQFALCLVGNKWNILTAWLHATIKDYGYIFSQKALLKEKLLLLLKVPVLNFSNAYAQYRAVRDERAGLERQVRGV